VRLLRQLQEPAEAVLGVDASIEFGPEILNFPIQVRRKGALLPQQCLRFREFLPGQAQVLGLHGGSTGLQ
jgi:hypothetical protein